MVPKTLKEKRGVKRFLEPHRWVFPVVENFSGFGEVDFEEYGRFGRAYSLYNILRGGERGVSKGASNKRLIAIYDNGIQALGSIFIVDEPSLRPP